MKVVNLAWTTPDGTWVTEQFDETKMSFSWEGSWLELSLKGDESQLVRLLPAHVVRLVEWGEIEDPKAERPIIQTA